MVIDVLHTVIFLVIAVNLYALPTPPVLTKPERRWEDNPGAVEGDMVFAPPKARGVAIRRVGARWTNGIVPYEFLPGFTVEQQGFIVGVLRKMESNIAINNVRCIQFRPKTVTDQYYISIINGAGCLSSVGMPPYVGYNHTVSLNSIGCLDNGRIMHEMLHTLGFLHEQSRPDRDSYVRVNQANIDPSKLTNFDKMTDADVDTQSTAYDYESLMHYGPYEFSKNGLPTIEPLQPNVKIGQRYYLSTTDIQEVRLFYNCPASGVTLPPTTTTTTTANPSVITSTYPGTLTLQSPQYFRPNGTSTGHYYEIIEISVTTPGQYVFKGSSSMDTYGYIYITTYNPDNPSANIWAKDDDGNGDGQFLFQIAFGSRYTLTLVVTTYYPNINGIYSVIAIGPAAVTFVRKSTSVPPPTTTTTVTTSTTTKTSTVTSPTTTTTASSGCFPTSWNSSGSVVASGGYYGSVAVDDDFNVYVSDGNQFRLQKWTPGAAQPINLLQNQFSHNPLFFHSSTRSLYFLDSILGNPSVYKLMPGQPIPVKVAFGNGVGSALNQLARDCRGLHVNEAGDIYVLDAYNQRVLKWMVNGSSGILVAGGGGLGNGSTQMSDAHGLYVDTVNEVIYVADRGNQRIQKYTSGSVSGISVLRGGGSQRITSTGLREIYDPVAVFVDKIGYMLVGDWSRITRWAPDVVTASLVADGTQGFGAQAKRMEAPTAFAFDKEGNLYALDWYNQRVIKFNATSKLCPTPCIKYVPG